MHAAKSSNSLSVQSPSQLAFIDGTGEIILNSFSIDASSAPIEE